MTRVTCVLALMVGFLLFAGLGRLSAAESLEDHLRVVAPDGANGAPVVVFLQGSAGGDSRALRWARWLKEKGVASAVVDSLALRKLETFFGTTIDYGKDVVAALAALSDDPRVDVSRFAIMGFSRGGSRALTAGKFFEAEPSPALVVAMYPGEAGACLQNHVSPTRVVIFYGAKDLWGAFRGTRAACVKLAEREDLVEAHVHPRRASRL